MNKGMSLVSLTITIVVAIIIASILIIPSLDTLADLHEIRDENEFMDIVTYANKINVALAVGDTTDNLTTSTIASQNAILDFFSAIDDPNADSIAQQVSAINSNVNGDTIDGHRYSRYFHLALPKDLELGVISFPNIDLGVDTLQNKYLINFSTGTVIAEAPEGTIKVFGKIESYN